MLKTFVLDKYKNPLMLGHSARARMQEQAFSCLGIKWLSVFDRQTSSGAPLVQSIFFCRAEVVQLPCTEGAHSGSTGPSKMDKSFEQGKARHPKLYSFASFSLAI